MLQSVWLEVTESDGDGVCSAKSQSVEEDAPVFRWEYWPYRFGFGGDREGFCIAGSCLAVRGTIPVSTASGWTLVMFKWLGFIVLAYTNNGLFLPTCEEVWNGWLYTGRGWLEKLLGFRSSRWLLTPEWCRALRDKNRQCTTHLCHLQHETNMASILNERQVHPPPRTVILQYTLRHHHSP